MSGIDLAILAVIAVSALMSFLRGFVDEAVSLASWIAAVMLTLGLTTRVRTLIPEEAIASPAARTAISALALFLGTLAVGAVAGWLVRRIVGAARLGAADRVLGTVFGVARGALIVALLVLSAHLVPSLTAERWWRESRLLPRFEGAARLIHARLPEELARHFDFASASV